MGILDILQGNYGGGSPWGALYPSPLNDASAKREATVADVLAQMGLGPENMAKPSPFQAQPAPAAPGAPQFGAGAAPFSFGGPGSMTGINPAMMTSPAAPAPIAPASSPQAAPQPAPGPPAAPASNDDQADPIKVGSYQMPRIGAADDFEPDDATPAKSTATAGTLPAGPSPAATAPFSLAGPSVTGRIGAALQSMQGVHGLIPKLFYGGTALASGQRTDPAAQTQTATAQALVGKGASVADVQAAANNPTLMQALINQYYGKDKFSVTKTGADPLGGETYRVFNQADGTFKDIPKGGGEGAPSAIDSNLKGDDYLKQFTPEVQSMVKDYIAGKSVPTGNPRRDNVVKRIASKYGEDIGTPVDDATYFARKQMRTQLSSSAPSSLGGQINIGNTAAGHLADLSQKALDLGNYDMGLAPLSAAVNNARGLGTEQAAKMEALKGAAQHYGQEITKFYAGSPGGVAERDRFVSSVNGARSPKELAAILDTEAQLMRSRLDALGGQIKGVLGDEGMAQYPVLRPDGEKALTTVQTNVAALRGGGAAPAAAGNAVPPPGKYVWTPGGGLAGGK